MPLVDYVSSDSDADSDSASERPPPKRTKLDTSSDSTISPGSLPPLPPTFFDLYASTVRTSTADDPSLHQGRVRQTPHVAGNWPSHVYIEWHPPTAAYTLLTKLLSALQEKTSAEITTFLTSDLGAALPLHISLSRPISLNTSDKDEFLEQLVSSIRGSNIAPFNLSIRGVEWHRTEESGRSFLVLRLAHSGSDPTYDSNNNKNPELTELLKRCNKIATSYGQPVLYQWASDESSPKDTKLHSSSNEDPPSESNKPPVGDAFHISVAWSFSKPTEELKEATKRVFGVVDDERGGREIYGDTRVHVDGIKAKIGNVVTHIPLPEPGRAASRRKGSKQLLGLT